MSTKEAKLTFGYPEKRKTENGGGSTAGKLLDYLKEKASSFPLLNEGRRLSIEGTFGETGVVILSDGAFAAAVRSPGFIPQKVDIENNEIVFGGQPTEKMIELSLEIPFGRDKAAQIAMMILGNLRGNNTDPNLVSSAYAGFGAIGSEPEAWIIDLRTGNLISVSGGELQAGLLEETLPPIFDTKEFLKARARYTLDRASRFSSFYILDTSVLPTSDPLKSKVNTGHDLGPYVFALQSLLRHNAFNGCDPLAEAVFKQILHRHGINSHDDLKNLTGTMAYWVMAASHASVGLPHLRNKASEFFVPAEIAIAVSDIFNSDLATVAEFLMFSTPMIYGVGPIVIDNEQLWPRDYRVILRHLMDTTNPSPFIGNYEEMVKRISYGIVNGLTHTADRASYLTEVNGKLFAVMHGRVRNRVCSSEPKNQTGRVEFTGCGASPSYLDELARNCFLQLLAVAALEAIENRQTPMEYWGERYPHLASWENQKRYAQLASLYGFNHENIRPLINESVAFINEIIGGYPTLQEIGNIAISRILNLLESPVASLEDYIKNPQGPISEVIQNEIRRGLIPLELAGKIHEFQLKLAKSILNNS